ncbi:MAG TPA: hypothetical protein DEP84_02645, partial [Chloroflexi bacterium]|nr:hypothetical protein [Chloroflexota bacterium]
MDHPFSPDGPSLVCGSCEPEFDSPTGDGPAAGAPSLTFGKLARLFVDRRDVKFWHTEGPRHNHLYWVRAMLSEQAEPPPLVPRLVTQPKSEADRLRFAQARREVYGFLARAFEYPTDAFLADISNPRSVERLALEFRSLADNDDVNEGLALWRAMAGRGTTLVGEFGLSPLRRAYTRLIYDSELPCIPPYESIYCNERHVMGKPAAAVAAVYRGAGLGVDGHEMPDHIALECEFVAHLADREIAARQSGRREEARQLWAAERQFLTTHLLTWGGKFCADLS